jgi:hypothetical protein
LGLADLSDARLCRTTTSTVAASPATQAEAQDRVWRGGDILDPNRQGSTLDPSQDCRGHDQRHQRRSQHVAKELSTTEMEMAQDDEAGQL